MSDPAGGELAARIIGDTDGWAPAGVRPVTGHEPAADLRELKAAERATRKKLDSAAAAYGRALDEHTTAWWNRIKAERGIVITPAGGQR